MQQQGNATYSNLTFTVSHYGAYSLVSDILKQQGFDGIDDIKKALGGDEEIAKATKRWREFFGISELPEGIWWS